MNYKKILKRLFFSVSLLTFVMLFSCLSILNGWFFFDLGSNIPLSDNFTLAIPFLIMGIAVSIIASITSMVHGRVAFIAGLAFHALSVGITYTSINFALDVQSTDAAKSQQLLSLAKEKAHLADQQLAQSDKQVAAAKAGIGNADTAKIMAMRDREIEAAKNKIALNSNGHKAGTVWGMTNGCTKTGGFYAKKYKSVCDDINIHIPYRYKNMLVQASNIGTSLVRGEKALDKKEKALNEQNKAIENQKAAIVLPVILSDKELNKQYITLIIALLFEVALVILEWLLSGKIGTKKQPKTAQNACTELVQGRYKEENLGTKARTGKFSSIARLFGVNELLSAIRAKNRTIARGKKDLKKKEAELNKARAELGKMNIVEGAKAMREMTGFHVSRIFTDTGQKIGQEEAGVVALICRTYREGESLAQHKTYNAVRNLPECKEANPSRAQIKNAIEKMAGVLIEPERKVWINRGKIYDLIGQIRIAA